MARRRALARPDHLHRCCLFSSRGVRTGVYGFGQHIIRNNSNLKLGGASGVLFSRSTNVADGFRLLSSISDVDCANVEAGARTETDKVSLTPVTLDIPRSKELLRRAKTARPD